MDILYELYWVDHFNVSMKISFPTHFTRKCFAQELFNLKNGTKDSDINLFTDGVTFKKFTNHF